MEAFFMAFFTFIITFIIIIGIFSIIALVSRGIAFSRLKMEMESTKNYTWHESLTGIHGGTAIALDRDKLILGLFYNTKYMPRGPMSIYNIIGAVSQNKKAYHRIVECEDLLGAELVSDGEVITQITKGDLGRAILGGTLFGGTGAIVGALSKGYETRIEKVNQFSLKIIINDLTEPEFFVELSGSGSTKDSWQYTIGKRNGERWISFIKILMKEAERRTKQENKYYE